MSGHASWYVYRLYNTNGRLIYVGKTYNTKNRFSQHANTQPWWDEVCIELTHVETYATESSALSAEKYVIRTEHPTYNKQHNDGFRVSGAVRDELSIIREVKRNKCSSYTKNTIRDKSSRIREISGLMGRGRTMADAALEVIGKTDDSCGVRIACELLINKEESALIMTQCIRSRLEQRVIPMITDDLRDIRIMIHTDDYETLLSETGEARLMGIEVVTRRNLPVDAIIVSGSVNEAGMDTRHAS